MLFMYKCVRCHVEFLEKPPRKKPLCDKCLEKLNEKEKRK